MPKVGKKHFAYSKEGKKMAKKYAKASGHKIEEEKPKKESLDSIRDLIMQELKNI